MTRPVFCKFNRGEISALATCRDDVERIRDGHALVENFLPMRLGPMTYRPGTKMLDTLLGVSYFVPFVAATDDTALLEFSDLVMRVWVGDELLARTGVSTAVTNGTFTSDVSSWTDADESGAVSSWKTGGYLSLRGTGTTAAIRWQTCTTQTGAEHGLRVIVARAPVQLRLGTSGANSDDIYSGTLLPGTHSLSFTPSANVTITLSNSLKYEALVDVVAFEGAGTVAIATDVTESDLPNLRYRQSADVVFCACYGLAQFRVERRGVKSWSVVDTRVDDGPFETINLTDVTMAAAALSGDTTLTASRAFFQTGHVGALFKVSSAGQTVTASVGAADAGTNAIRVTGIDSTRLFTIQITGTFTATVTLQRSADELSWEDLDTYTSPTSTSYDDSLDNSVLYYRLWVQPGDYTSGTADLSLIYSAGSIEGVCRVTEYVSATVANVQVVDDLGSTSATRDWYEGSWSGVKGHPSAVTINDGRLWCAGKNKIWGSISDAYSNFDRGIEGDSASIQKTIGFGPVDNVLWLAGETQLVMGLASAEIGVRSTSLDETLTANNTRLKAWSTQGSSGVAPSDIDLGIYFVQQSGRKVFGLVYDGANYQLHDSNLLHPDIVDVDTRIVRLAVARQPETRIFAVLDDGTVRVLLVDAVENIEGWSRLSHAAGEIEDVVTLPSSGETAVYVVVNRGGDRYLERVARMADAVGQHLDSHVPYTSPGLTLTGLDHLEGLDVRVWADDEDRGNFTVSGGSVTVDESWTTACVGLQHVARWQSNRLSGYVEGRVINERSRISDVGLVMANYAPGFVQFGPDFSTLDDMPGTEDGAAVTTDVQGYDYDSIPFNGTSGVDGRIAVEATGPCTMLALTFTVYDRNTANQKG